MRAQLPRECPSVLAVWALSPDVHHLNHGSFGAVPLEVLDKQHEWRMRWEANTTGFILEEVQPALDQARVAVASFLEADPAGLVFVRNATSGVASVVKTIEHTLMPGDELLTTSHDYNAIRQTLEFTADRTGASVVVPEVPFPIETPSQVTEAVLDAASDRTRLAVIDHITSPTGVVYPVEEIVAGLEPDIPVVVDGAHGPGQVPLDVGRIGASWYTGNLHKWTCAPKGAAFLHTRRDRVEETVPVVISHGWNEEIPDGRSRYWALFDWLGTDDMTQWLVVPDALRLVGSLDPGGWSSLMARNHELVIAARNVICEALEIEPSVPDEMVGTMAAVILPDGEGPDPGGALSPLNFELLERGFETLVMIWPQWPSQVLRVSAYQYNSLDEYEALAGELSQLVG